MRPSTNRDRAIGIIATTAVLALLYVGRDVLVPIALAFILSLLLQPLVRLLRRAYLGQTLSVMVAVIMATLAFAAVAGVIGSQIMHMSANLPAYERTIEHKVGALNEVAVAKFNALTRQMGHTVSRRGAYDAAQTLSPVEMGGSHAPIPVEVHEPPPSPLQVVERVVGSVWVPIETAGIVLVVLIFVLLEHESLRDRFIRLAGGSNIRRSTLAINDAGERLSRFFVSQFAVNIGVGLFVGLGVSLIRLPHPLLWAALAAVLRFVPYVGIWIAALFSATLAAAVDPGWGLALESVGLFVAVELIAGQLVEPHLYGHTTGLSPLSVVISAIFWSWLWGPVGLIVSTPLTLCLVVAGRHIHALSLLDLLLGNNEALTMPERFYQRALSGDASEIIASARVFLKRNSFANYCDLVLLPALHLARIDLQAGAITPEQQQRVRICMMGVVAALGAHSSRVRRRYRSPVLEANYTVGRALRRQREEETGRWQGPLLVPAGSVMVCLSLGSMADDLATELLVRILREQKIDARHMALDDLAAVPPPNAAEAVAIVYVVSAFPSEERGRGEAAVVEMRRRFPHATVVAVYLPGMLLEPESSGEILRGADKQALSLGQAVQVGLDWVQRSPPGMTASIGRRASVQ